MTTVSLEQLDSKHESYDRETWDDLNALYAGGKCFRDRIERFLIQNEMEPAAVYERRKAEASYRSFVGPIVDYYAAWLFSGSMYIRAKNADTGETIDDKSGLDPWYAEFREDCGGDVDLKDFLKARFTTALVKGRAHYLAVLPQRDMEPTSAAEYEVQGLGNATLCAVDPDDLYDWECDDSGALLWCSIHSQKKKRASIAIERRMVTETWRVYDRETVTTYEITYEENQRPAPTTLVNGTTAPHYFLQVPLLTIPIPEGLQLGNRLRDPQLEHFRLATALSWGIKRTCYSMPVFNIEDRENPPIMGTGYFIMIGKDEKFAWAAPPSDHLQAISKEVDQQRNDIYKISTQSAAGLDNNAETVGRSADSKAQDIAATKIMLDAYGAVMAAVIEETFELVSDARGDKNVFWSIEGFSGYDTATAPELIANATNATLLNIPSKTYHTEIKTKAALATVPEASQDTKNKIRAEVAAGVEAAGDLVDLMATSPTQNGGKDEAPAPAPGVGGAKPKSQPKPAASGG